MNEEEFIDYLTEALLELAATEDDGIASLRDFQESMLLTTDKGLVVKLNSGEEFQVTVVRSK